MNNFTSHKSALFVTQLRCKAAFSLIEMLMALLVASLLMAALAPVMIKKARENVSLTGEVNAPKLKTHEVRYNDENCKAINEANNTCEGQFLVPSGFNGSIYLTMIGGGGGGGTAITSGSVEYTTSGEFVVPAGVDEIEVVIVGGGSGGAGGQVALNNAEFTTVGANTLNIASATGLKGSPMLVTLIGGGGAGGSGGFWAGAGGGSGAYFDRQRITLPSNYAPNTIPVTIGAGGVSGGGYRAGNGGGATTVGADPWGISAGGGGGGAGEQNSGGAGVNPTFGGGVNSRGGTGGDVIAPSPGMQQSTGGSGGLPNGTNGENSAITTNSLATMTPGLRAGLGAASQFGAAGAAWVVNQAGGNAVGFGAGGTATSSNTPSVSPIAGAGRQGYARIQYPTFIRYGGGGGGGQVIPPTRVKVTPGERITVTVGGGGAGGSAPVLNNDATITVGTNGGAGGNSLIRRTAGVILTTSAPIGATTGGGWGGPPVSGSGGSGTGDGAGARAADNTCWVSRYGSSDNAGNSPTINDTSQSGSVWLNCAVAGRGGTLSSGFAAAPDGTGIGGGGGAGWGWGRGGNGAPGYIKITWNPNKIGTGGGGASANYLYKYKLEGAKSGSTIKYQIGAGGAGAYVNGPSLTNGAYGGDTIFGIGLTSYRITAGGGYGGISSTITGAALNTTLFNGAGGKKADVCKANGADIAACTDSVAGFAGTNASGGKGATSRFGAGANGSASGNGGNALDDNLGAGGGGAGFSDVGLVASPPQNTKIGGKGAPGKIIIEWYE